MSFFEGLKEAFKGSGRQGEKWNIPQTRGDLDELFRPDAGVHLICEHSFSCAPQAILLRNGSVLWHGSHNSVDSEAVQRY